LFRLKKDFAALCINFTGKGLVKLIAESRDEKYVMCCEEIEDALVKWVTKKE
jgi:hypothetical protein